MRRNKNMKVESNMRKQSEKEDDEESASESEDDENDAVVLEDIVQTPTIAGTATLGQTGQYKTSRRSLHSNYKTDTGSLDGGMNGIDGLDDDDEGGFTSAHYKTTRQS